MGLKNDPTGLRRMISEDTGAIGVTLYDEQGNYTPGSGRLKLVAITPSDSEVLDDCRGLRVDADGVLKLQWGEEAIVTLNVIKAEVLPVTGTLKVLATGTTATVHGYVDASA